MRFGTSTIWVFSIMDLTRFGGYPISSLERRPTLPPTRPPYPPELIESQVKMKHMVSLCLPMML